jgi:hypothetical protein
MNSLQINIRKKKIFFFFKIESCVWIKYLIKIKSCEVSLNVSKCLSKQRCIFRWLLSSIYQRIICLADAMTEWRRHLGGETKRLDDDGSGSDVYNMAKRFCEVNLNQNCWSIWVFFSNSLNRMKFSTL